MLKEGCTYKTKGDLHVKILHIDKSDEVAPVTGRVLETSQTLYWHLNGATVFDGSRELDLIFKYTDTPEITDPRNDPDPPTPTAA